MKIKLIIALVVLALVFGISFTACDDGELEKITSGEKETILDKQYVPYLDKDGKIAGNTGNTVGDYQWYKVNDAGGDDTKVPPPADPDKPPKGYYKKFIPYGPGNPPPPSLP